MLKRQNVCKKKKKRKDNRVKKCENYVLYLKIINVKRKKCENYVLEEMFLCLKRKNCHNYFLYIMKVLRKKCINYLKCCRYMICLKRYVV